MAEVTKLGELLDEHAQRDAVHIAVAPVIAAERLSPGDHIGFVGNDTERVGRSALTPLGIVDPFLTTRVTKGERFWMFLYPQTITSLRHQWTHPAFAVTETVDTEKARSERWLRAFVAASDCPSYEEVVAVAITHEREAWGDDDDYLLFRGVDAHGEIPPEFWDHIEVVTGRKIAPNHRPKSFSCSC
jgi:hypothetical protein